MVAVGVVAVPSGLIANGFSQVLEESRKAKHMKRRSAAVKLQRLVRQSLSPDAVSPLYGRPDVAQQHFIVVCIHLASIRTEGIVVPVSKTFHFVMGKRGYTTFLPLETR